MAQRDQSRLLLVLLLRLPSLTVLLQVLLLGLPFLASQGCLSTAKPGTLPGTSAATGVCGLWCRGAAWGYQCIGLIVPLLLSQALAKEDSKPNGLLLWQSLAPAENMASHWSSWLLLAPKWAAAVVMTVRCSAAGSFVPWSWSMVPLHPCILAPSSCLTAWTGCCGGGDGKEWRTANGAACPTPVAAAAVARPAPVVAAAVAAAASAGARGQQPEQAAPFVVLRRCSAIGSLVSSSYRWPWAT
eukprot:1157065-Pelagomonas_calceolata.AAC.28